MSVLRGVVVIRPQKAEILCHRLIDSRLVEELSLNEVFGCGRQAGGDERDHEYAISVLPKVRLQFYCHAQDREALVELIMSTCRTGRIGDGKIFFMSLDHIIEYS